MSVQVEKLEHNMAKLTVEVSAGELEKALNSVYQKEKRRINIPGFRKGKVPRQVVEKMFGAEIFYEDAANILLQKTYPSAVDECGEDIVSRPSVEIVQIEKGQPFIYTAEVAVKPGVTLGKYMGIEVTRVDTSVTDKEVDEELERERNSNARTITVTDRPIEKGDTAVIDFEGFVDGEAFEGGKGVNHSLEIGSHSFIDTFEDQLVGKNAGDEVEVHVTFPEQYQAAELAGKPAIFQVKIHEIRAKELPELDDEYAQDVSEFDTLAEYREGVRGNLEEKKKNEAKQQQEDEAVRQIIDGAEMDIPDAMIESQCENMLDEFEQRIQQGGLSMEQYIQMSGTSQEALMEQARPEAVTRIQSSLVLEQIAKEENIEVTEEDIEAEIKKLAGMYGMDVDRFRSFMGDSSQDSIKRDIAITKAVELVMENAVEVEKKED